MSSFNELIAQYIISSWVLVNLFSTVEPKFKISTVKATLYPKKIVETVTETRSKREKYPKTKNKGRRKKKKKMPSNTFSGTVSTPKLSVAVDMGNPFLNLTVDAFLKIGAVGITKSLAEDTYKAIDKGSLSKSTLEHALKKLCKEGVYWGAAGGVYIGTEYGIERIRGSRDWKNAMLAGAATGAVLSAVGKKGKDTIVIDAILGGALATASQFVNNHYFY